MFRNSQSDTIAVSGAAVSSSVIVLKSLVQSQFQLNTVAVPSPIPSSHSTLAIISKLAARLDEITHAPARACVLWLVGQYSVASGGQGQGQGLTGIAEWAPDVLRRVAKTFASEVCFIPLVACLCPRIKTSEQSSIVKLQIVTLAAKLQLLSPENHTLTLLTRYIFSLSKYDPNYDVRDRARMLSSLLAGAVPGLSLLNGTADEESGRGGRTEVVLRREQAKLVLFDGKIGVVERKIWSGELHSLDDHI